MMPSNFHSQNTYSTKMNQPVLVNIRENIARLVAEEDTDGDKKITIEDSRLKLTERGDKRFWLVATDGKKYEIVGTYYLSNLLQELKLAEDSDAEVTKIYFQRIFENPAKRITRSIRDIYWDNLTRRIDKQHLLQVLKDSKVSTGKIQYLYVPDSDTLAYQYFSDIAETSQDFKFRVIRLPEKITPEYVKSLAHKHGLLNLALELNSEGEYEGVPYVVPGGRFNEMYGWDSYFITLGLLEDGRIDLAKSMVDNFVYQINYYGKIINANRSYYLTRSQPPFLTSMALEIYKYLPKNTKTVSWLQNVFRAAIKEYEEVWMNEDHLTETGLSRFYGSGLGPPPEVERGHFDEIYHKYAVARNMKIRQFEELYTKGKIYVPKLDRFFIHDRAVRESGHDTTYRWNLNGDRCADFVTVDLNSLLYKIEIDIARTIEREFNGILEREDGGKELSSAWYEKAERRKYHIDQYLWDEEYGMFFDYDFVNHKHYPYVSATTFYPIWACYPDDSETWLVNSRKAEKLVKAALPLLEMAGGIAASDEKSRGPISDSRPARQWDYPYGWAPHQMLVWKGLMNYGYKDIAYRLIYKWLYTIIRNAVDFNGTIPEKFDVVKRTHEVFIEYGNIGTQFDYITKEGFGWMNTSYQLGRKLLPEELREQMEKLVPPEWIFDE